VGTVVSVLRRIGPRLLYLPHPGDGSFDHQAAFVTAGAHLAEVDAARAAYDARAAAGG
jgi:hypothetical protein